MLTPLKMAIVTVFLIVSASTALAQTIPIDNQNLLEYGPSEKHERSRVAAPTGKTKADRPIWPVIFFSIDLQLTRPGVTTPERHARLIIAGSPASPMSGGLGRWRFLAICGRGVHC